MKYLATLDLNKSTGADNIGSRLLYNTRNATIDTLCNIVNESITSGTFPMSWKEAKVLPLYKAGSHYMMDNYRPISILPVASKILEKHFHKHLYSYFNENNLMCETQSGFRPNHSCSTCLINIVEYCHNQLNNDNVIGFIALDFRKAFDVLNHVILCEKLKLYGCNDNTVKWFRSYLNNRTQKVTVNNHLSSLCVLSHGVPQGSILGPLLFLIFINDLVLHCQYSNVHKYADDTSLCAAGKTVADVNDSLSQDLLSIEKWCKSNKFVLNANKCSAMLICTSQKRRNLNVNDFSIGLYGSNIPVVSCIKVLGLYIDNDFTWKSHVDSLCNTISSLIGLFYKIRKFLNYDSKVLFYNSYILPRIDFCLAIWGNAPNMYLEKIFRLQKRAACIVLNIPMDTSSFQVFKQLKWMSIYQRIFYQKCVLMYHIVSNLCPFYLQSCVSKRQGSCYNLRSMTSHTLNVPFPRKEMFKKSLMYSGAKIWNYLPKKFKEISNIHTFKYHCKCYVLDYCSFYHTDL